MDIISSLREKYTENAYILRKIDQHLQHMPALMESLCAERKERETRKQEEAAHVKEFMERFLNLHLFYYVSSTDQFLHYNNNAYSNVSEGELSQFIMCVLNLDQTFGKLKFKVRRQLMKEIRQHHPLTLAKPSSVTEANVSRAFLTKYFSAKSHIRYFLTVVGDLVLGKRDRTFFIDSSFRPLIAVLDQEVNKVMNKSIGDAFKYKYCDHDYETCRIVPGVAPENARLRVNANDMVAVALYYSGLYGSSDECLLETDPAFCEHVLRLKCNSPNGLLQSFLTEYTLPQDWTPFKDIYFVWKTFLRQRYLPNVISKSNLKHMLSGLNLYNAALDVCALSPKFSPILLNFGLFWHKHLKPRADEEYEVAEVVELYNGVCETNLQITVDECNGWLAQNNIDSGPKVLGVFCDLWDKAVDIDNALELYDSTGATGSQYAFYVDRTKRFNNMVVTVDYFERYVERFGA